MVDIATLKAKEKVATNPVIRQRLQKKIAEEETEAKQEEQIFWLDATEDDFEEARAKRSKKQWPYLTVTICSSINL